MQCNKFLQYGVVEHFPLVQVDEQGNITESCFKTFGCGSAIASSSVATEWYVAPFLDFLLCPALRDNAFPQIDWHLCPALLLLLHCAVCCTWLLAHVTQCAERAATVFCRVKGKSIDEVLTIKNSDIAKHLSLPPVKLHCSMLAEDAIKAAVKDVQAKRAKMAAAQQQHNLDDMEQPDGGEKLAAAAAS